MIYNGIEYEVQAERRGAELYFVATFKDGRGTIEVPGKGVKTGAEIQQEIERLIDAR